MFSEETFAQDNRILLFCSSLLNFLPNKGLRNRHLEFTAANLIVKAIDCKEKMTKIPRIYICNVSSLYVNIIGK